MEKETKGNRGGIGKMREHLPLVPGDEQKTLAYYQQDACGQCEERVNGAVFHLGISDIIFAARKVRWRGARFPTAFVVKILEQESQCLKILPWIKSRKWRQWFAPASMLFRVWG